MVKKKLIRTCPVKCPKTLIAGDPEVLANNPLTTNEIKRKNIPYVKRNAIANRNSLLCRINVSKVRYPGEKPWYEISILAAQNQDIIDVYQDNRQFIGTKTKNVDFGNDTEKLLIRTDKDEMYLSIGEDICYGRYQQYKKEYGFRLDLYLTEKQFKQEKITEQLLEMFYPWTSVIQRPEVMAHAV